MNILFICTSNEDRSPALEKYFREHYPKHGYKSAGINKYHSESKGNHYLTKDDIFGSDLVVFCEKVHKNVVMKKATEYEYSVYLNNYQGKELILALGKYEKGNINEDYLKRAEEKLKQYLVK